MIHEREYAGPHDDVSLPHVGTDYAPPRRADIWLAVIVWAVVLGYLVPLALDREAANHPTHHGQQIVRTPCLPQ
jgi:hypothetical protein